MSTKTIQLEDEFWENRYQNNTAGWDRGKPSEGLIYWLDTGLLTPNRILIPGCGNGYEVITLAEKGFDVSAIDIAPTPIKNLKTALADANLSANLFLQDFFSWQPEAPFDVIYEQTSLCALPSDLWQQYENKLHQWLKSDGILLAQFMQTGKESGPPFHCDMNEMRSLFPTDRWVWSEQYNSLEMAPGLTELMYVLKKT